jgi:hypothetical protein
MSTRTVDNPKVVSREERLVYLDYVPKGRDEDHGPSRCPGSATTIAMRMDA